jgi:hypothetical protein
MDLLFTLISFKLRVFSPLFLTQIVVCENFLFVLVSFKLRVLSPLLLM